MSKPLDLTPQALEGYRGEANTYLATSPSWYAFKLGVTYRIIGYPAPTDVRMGRGSIVRVGDMKYQLVKRSANDVKFLGEKWERVQ